MSNKYTKIIAAFGMAAGLGVATLPVAGVFADKEGTAGDTANAEVQLGVTIASSIGLSVGASDVNAVEMTAGQISNKVMNSHLTVSTNANKGYTLTIQDADAETALVSGENKILAADGALTSAGGWNYTVDGDLELANKEITASPVTIAQSNAPTADGGAKTTVYYNVSTKSDQPNGIYRDTITYTATAYTAGV